MLKPFSGSYAAQDVDFLLTELKLDPIDDVQEKERLIQSGEKHYSEIIGRERLPSDEYIALYRQALAANRQRVARDALQLAQRIHALRGDSITLVSLARAGTPLGVLLRRIFAARFGLDTPHYAISIIRDRGIDGNALDYILRYRPAASVCFVDGWTGKGAISQELQSAMVAYNASRGVQVPVELFVQVDLAGVATAAGSMDDYLIPSAILNAPVSGLVSRTILNDSIGADDWHGCLYYREWLERDCSRDYIESIMAVLGTLDRLADPSLDTAQRRADMVAFIAATMTRYRVRDRNLVKPGIGEATRAVLRRTPERVVLRRRGHPDLAHLEMLCRERGVAVSVDAGMPVKALAIIGRHGDV
jgi:hypothetical protein